MYEPGAMKKQITADKYQRMETPDDMDDAWVLLPGRTLLSEVWDCGIERPGGKIILYGRFGEIAVTPETTIYYT